MLTDVTKVEHARRYRIVFLSFPFAQTKGRFPPLHGTHIYNTHFVLHFFLFALCLPFFYYPRARTRHGALATRTWVFHDDNYSLPFSFLSLFHYHLLIIIIALHLSLTNCLTDAPRSVETQRSIPQILARFVRSVN